VGVLHGAMFCSALAGNGIDAVGIDNFSQPDFGGSADETRANIQKWKGASDAHLMVMDALEVQPRTLGKFDLFFYDAGHSSEETARALVHFLPALTNPFLFLVDDYEWPFVRAGVAQGLKTAGLHIQREWQLGLGREKDGENWWNGMALMVLGRGK
jgi:hypothetical protein